MIKLSNINLLVSANPDEMLKKIAAEKLRTSEKNIKEIKILKRSVDARKKDNLLFTYTIALSLFDERIVGNYEKYEEKEQSISNMQLPPLDKNKIIAIIGSGPAGLFAALTLINRGVKPIIFERGYDVDRRDKEIDNFIKTNILNPKCNIQFGEGGAGTYSDGKLNTGTKSEYIETVLKEFVNFGAPEEILYLNKPHIGTDILRNVVKNMREHIISLGGKFYFGTRVSDIEIKDNTLKKIKFDGENNGEMNVDGAIFAIGHSSRDTYEMLFGKKIVMERKPFSIGVRIEHLQSDINKSQYGVEKSEFLPSADYKLAARNKEGRGVYTFCMCPGGIVVCGSSEEKEMVTNGMSYHKRDGKNANSALLVSVEPKDFGDGNVLKGIEFQRKYERLAYNLSGSYKAVVTTFEDLKKNKLTTTLSRVTPSIKSGYVFGNLRECLPSYVVDGLIFGVDEFSKKIRCFNNGDAILCGVETRSSSPVRIIRDDNFMSSVKNLYPCGEGAGYAGGITSAAVDGIKTAIKVI